ncbi:MAG: hypothetical protein JST26_06050 [Bacteroidetes bacterium]|nr:hypothetical protein [Bacteroidota bacterium]
MKKNLYNDHWELDNSDKNFTKVFLLFAFIILISQILQFVNTKIIDSKHNQNLEERNAIARSSQSAILFNTNIQRALLNLIITSDSIEVNEMKRRIANSTRKHDQAVKTISDSYMALGKKDDPLLINLLESDVAYKNAVLTFQDLVFKGKKDEATQFRNTTLRPALETYLSFQEDMMAETTSMNLIQSNEINTYATISGWVLFIIGISPYIYILFALFKFSR